MNDIKLNYDDITIIPEVVTGISSRKECNPFDEKGMLPIFASCMDTVVNMNNIFDFYTNQINVILPRNYSFGVRLDFLEETKKFPGIFTAVSLAEAQKLISKNYFKDDTPKRICIDLANGHMENLLNTIRQLKEKYGEQLIIMSGNIANPETYKKYEEVGCDYVRVTIGSGSGCLTASNTGIYYPSFSLLEEMYNIKKDINGKCKIIADGGIRGYRDIQKALLFADYVMIGGLFNKAIESAGITTYGTSYWNIRGKKIMRPIKTLLTYGKVVPESKYSEVITRIKNGTLTVWKQFHGMSTKEAQKNINNANGNDFGRLKTSEGKTFFQKVEYSIKGWTENEIDYLRSAMSYTNSRTLEEYKNSKYVKMYKIGYNL